MLKSIFQKNTIINLFNYTKYTMEIKIINQSKNPLPKYQTVGSSGMDLMADLKSSIVLKPMERKIISTGLYIELSFGYEAQIRPRSGLAIKYGITCLNSPGTIDSDYRGEIGVILINLSDDNFVVNSGDRVAQMIITKYETAYLTEVESLLDTQRNLGGLGSTGI